MRAAVFSFRLQCSTVLGVSMGQARPFLAALITLMLFTGCSPDVALITYPEFGKSLVADLQARNFEAVEAKLDLALKRTTTRAKLLEMAQVLPATAPTSVRVAQLHVMSTWQLAGSEPRRVWLALQYQFTDKWVLATFVWRENERGFQAIDGFQITPLPASLETINRFTLVDKGLTHHVVLGLAVALPLFTVFVLVLCLTTSMPRRRKTLWALANSVWGDRAPIQLDKRRRRRLAAPVISAFLSGLCSSRTRATHYNLSGPPFRGDHLSFKAWLDQICWGIPSPHRGFHNLQVPHRVLMANSVYA